MDHKSDPFGVSRGEGMNQEEVPKIRKKSMLDDGVEEEKKRKKAAKIAKNKLKREKLKAKFANKNKKFLQKMEKNLEGGVLEQLQTEDENLQHCQLCSEPIQKDEDYKMLGLMQNSNILIWSKIQSLESLLTSTTINFSAEEIDEITTLAADLRTDISKNKPGSEEDSQNVECLINTCSHVVHTRCQELPVSTLRSYSEEEFPCSLCKNPSNLMIHVYKSFPQLPPLNSTPIFDIREMIIALGTNHEINPYFFHSSPEAEELQAFSNTMCPSF